MLLRLALSVLLVVGLAGCAIPPVDTKYVSQVPASPESFAVAQRAVRACSEMPNRNNVVAAFKRYGFEVSEQEVLLRRGRTIKRLIVDAPDDAVSVLYHDKCYVGLEGMTPEQSRDLAMIWVRRFEAKPNSAYGDGLSDHVSGAWRSFFTEPHRFPDKAAYVHRIYIAAYKTWPHGPYDPQRNVPFDIGKEFPDRPGAAVTLNYVTECKPHVKTGPRSGVFLPCAGSEHRFD